MRWFWIATIKAVLEQDSALGFRDDEVGRDLARRLAQHDAEAFAMLYDRHSRAVFSLAFRILGDQTEAEDIVQEVFTQAWRQSERYDPTRGHPAAWLLNMARSRSIDQLRRSRHLTLTDEGTMPDLPSGAPPVEVAVVNADEARAVRRALASLPPLQRTAIELAYYEGLSQTEIADRLEQPLGTVKTRVRLGLLKLREAMAGGGT
jgi:RNA polymerase sigma-70 factor (ECF subfamily)